MKQMLESRGSRRPCAMITLVALVATTATLGLSVIPSEAAEGVRVIGFMDSVSSSDLHRMLVDADLNIGATIGSSGGTILLYDLEKLKWIPLPPAKASVPTSMGGISADKAVVDEVNHRIFFTPGNLTDLNYSGCASGPNSRFGIGVFSLITHEWSSVPVKCTPYISETADRSNDQFKVQGVFYYPPTDRLYVAGTPQGEWFAHERGNVYTRDRTGIGMLLRQMDPKTGNVDWEIDLRGTGCDRMVIDVSGENVGAFIARFGRNVYSYCFGVRASIQGDQGFALNIPLGSDGEPLTSEGRPVVKLTPTLPNDLFPMLDPVTGNLLLLTSGRPNGDAVWVYNPQSERFEGVIASGISAADIPNARTAAGQNTLTGRTYMLTAAGMLVADSRHRPLPSGLNYNIGVAARRSGPLIAIAPKLNRMFMPVSGFKYIVLEDNLPRPPDAPKADPDGGTSNISEVEGKTISSFSGASAGFGARFLNTGGITRMINNLDLACYNQGLGPVVKDTYGRCPADQILTGGTRDLFLGPTRVQLGSQTGAVAQAAGAAFSSADTASDRDLKRMNTCFADIYENRRGQPAPPAYETFCGSIPFFADFESGTRGTDGKGAPIPGSSCADFGDKSDTATQPSTPAYASFSGSSNVECDANRRAVTATASASGFAFPNTTSPIVSVARAWSTSSSKVTAQGTLTTIESVATGVKIGEYSLGRLSTTATTRAHGRPGTNSVQLPFIRTISEVHGPNINCFVCDYNQVMEAMNRGLGLKMRVSQPGVSVFKSPLGYQSFVVKDQAARESDRATNNDDTYVVPALQVVVYNDGHDGRNRFIFQLAGVQAESQYGIVALPELGEPGFASVPIRVDSLSESISFNDPVVLGAEKVDDKTPPVLKVLRAPAQFIEDATRLIIHNPKEFGLLFILWSLIGAPLYLALRRWSLVREVRT